MMSADKLDPKPLLIARGGPFFEFQRRVGFLSANGSSAPARIIAVVIITWVVPLLLSASIFRAYGPLHTRPFLLDPGTWARFLIATGLLLAAEGRIEAAIWKILERLLGVPIVSINSRAMAIQSIDLARARRDSSTAEAICLSLAVMLSVMIVYNSRGQSSSSWAVTIADGRASITLA